MYIFPYGPGVYISIWSWSLGKDSLSRPPSRRSDNEVPIVTDEESVAFVPSAEIIKLADLNTPQYFRRVLAMLQFLGKVGCKKEEFKKARYDRPRRIEIHFLPDARTRSKLRGTFLSQKCQISKFNPDVLFILCIVQNFIRNPNF